MAKQRWGRNPMTGKPVLIKARAVTKPKVKAKPATKPKAKPAAKPAASDLLRGVALVDAALAVRAKTTELTGMSPAQIAAIDFAGKPLSPALARWRPMARCSRLPRARRRPVQQAAVVNRAAMRSGRRAPCTHVDHGDARRTTRNTDRTDAGSAGPASPAGARAASSATARRSTAAAGTSGARARTPRSAHRAVRSTRSISAGDRGSGTSHYDPTDVISSGHGDRDDDRI